MQIRINFQLGRSVVDERDTFFSQQAQATGPNTSRNHSPSIACRNTAGVSTVFPSKSLSLKNKTPKQ